MRLPVDEIATRYGKFQLDFFAQSAERVFSIMDHLCATCCHGSKIQMIVVDPVSPHKNLLDTSKGTEMAAEYLSSVSLGRAQVCRARG